MTQPIQSQPIQPSPFRFDTTPNGEADVAPDEIAVLSDHQAGTPGWGEDGFGFGDLLDIVNPLQHIPVVSTIYRELTGDQIAAAPKAIGGALYGGPLGLIAALGDSIVEAETGKDMAGATLALLDGSGSETTSAPQADTGQFQQLAATPTPNAATPVPVLAQTPAPAAVSPDSLSRAEPKARMFPLTGQHAEPPRPMSAAAARIYAQARRPAPPEDSLQSVSGNALDRLIARSQAAHAAGANPAAGAAPSTGSAAPLPTGQHDVRDLMLRNLGKYETMRKQ